VVVADTAVGIVVVAAAVAARPAVDGERIVAVDGGEAAVARPAAVGDCRAAVASAAVGRCTAAAVDIAAVVDAVPLVVLVDCIVAVAVADVGWAALPNREHPDCWDCST